MYSTPFFSLDICLKNDNYDNCDNCDNDGACGNDDSTCWLITILMIDDKALVALGIYLLKFCLREREKNTKRLICRARQAIVTFLKEQAEVQ